MSQEKFNEFEKAFVMDAVMRADKIKHAGLFSDTLSAISANLRKLDLQEIETILRENKGTTHLVGLKIQVPGLEALLPHTGRKPFPYYLHIAVNGDYEAFLLFQNHGINAEINFQRLAETGLLQKWVRR